MRISITTEKTFDLFILILLWLKTKGLNGIPVSILAFVNLIFFPAIKRRTIFLYIPRTASVTECYIIILGAGNKSQAYNG
jgi:hypothetical protein